MSDRDPGLQHDRCGEDVAAYALGALSPEEAAAFEAHLADCAVCSEELAAFRQVVDAMPLTAAPQRAPRAVRRHVMQVVNREADAAGRAPRRRSLATFVSAAPARPLAVCATALAVAVIAVVGIKLGSSGSNTRVYEAQVTGKGSAQLTVNGTHADLVVRHFAVPAKGHVYEMWLARPGKAPVPAGPAPAEALFNVTQRGSGGAHLPINVHRGDEVLVSVEPAGGKTSPTTTPVMSVKLS